MIPEPSGPTKAADEQAFAQAQAQSEADAQRRQAQAKAFQENRTPPPGGVTAGQERLD